MKAAILFLGALLLFLPTQVLAITDNQTQNEEKQVEKLERKNQNTLEKTTREEKKLEMKIAAENKKLLMDSLKAERQASLSALKTQIKNNLLKVRDEKKKVILEKLGEKVIMINQNRVDHFEKVIAKLEELLARIESKANELESSGKDTSELDAAIATASTDLAAAAAAVETQAGKEYTLNVVSSSGLKNEAGKYVSGMQSDLRTTAAAVNKAKKSVHTSLMLLKRTYGGPLPKTGTPSATPVLTPTIIPSTTPTSAPSAVPTL